MPLDPDLRDRVAAIVQQVQEPGAEIRERSLERRRQAGAALVEQHIGGQEAEDGSVVVDLRIPARQVLAELTLQRLADPAVRIFRGTR